MENLRMENLTTAAILADIAKFQNMQKQMPATTATWENIGKRLAPLFAEMARRQNAGIK
jgi:hypothetical protein